MVALAERLTMVDDLRYGWLQANDAYLLCELNNIFGKELFIRGSKIYVEKSRIMFYRPSKSWSKGRSGRSHFRSTACRFVRLKRQILTIFDEELNSSCTS